MKKNLRYKVFIGIAIAMLIAMIAVSIAAFRLTKLTPCGDDPDHFKDEYGNGYCIAEEKVGDFENSPVVVLQGQEQGP